MRDLSDVPDGWRVVRIGDVSEVNHSNWDPGDRESIRYLDLTAVLAPGRLSSPKEIAAPHAPSRARRRVRSGDILVSTVRPNLRGFARVRRAADNLVASTGFAVVTPREDVDGSLLFHHVMTHRFARYLSNATTGQAYPAVRPSDIASYVLPLPPLSEQRGIAAVLDAIDEAIERTEAVISATERLRDALLHELLTRGVPGWHTEWRTVPGLGTIPADWQVAHLGAVASHITSGSRAWSTHFRIDGALFLRSQNISKGAIDRSDSVFVRPPADAEAARTRIRKGDILVSITGDPGKVTVADESIGEAFVSQHVALVRLNDQELSGFAGEFLQGRRGKKQFRRMVYGQTRPGLSLENVNSAKVPVPSPSERALIVLAGNSLRRSSDAIRLEHDCLESLQESLADALLTGRVRVSLDELPELARY